MADADLRALERRYRETGGAADHARWLVARVRAGDIDEARVRFAAELGHRGAGLAVGVDELLVAHLDVFAGDRADRGCDPSEVRARLALATIRLRLAAAAPHPRFAAVSALEAWVECPCEAHALGLRHAARGVQSFSPAELLHVVEPERAGIMEGLVAEITGRWARWAPSGAGEPWPVDVFAPPYPHVVPTALQEEVRRTHVGDVLSALHAALTCLEDGGRSVIQQTLAVGEEKLRAAFLAELVPWLLRETQDR